MKRISFILALLTLPVFSQESANYQNIIRQIQSGYTWQTSDVLPTGTGTAQGALTEAGSTFQLWTIHKTLGTQYLLDTKTVGAYMPTGDISVATTDATGTKWGVKRSRIDKPFTVTAVVSGLMKDTSLPDASRKVLMEQHIALYPANVISLAASTVLSNTPVATAFITAGSVDRQATTTTINYAQSSFMSVNPYTSKGEEHFVLHALADGNIAQTQLDSDYVQIWPLPVGALTGLTAGATYKGAMPAITVNLTNLYPFSTTDVVAYPVSDATKAVSLMTSKYVVDDKSSRTDALKITGYDAAFPTDGIYTVEVRTTDPFDTQKLVTITPIIVNRTLSIRAMQVGK